MNYALNYRMIFNYVFSHEKAFEKNEWEILIVKQDTHFIQLSFFVFVKINLQFQKVNNNLSLTIFLLSMVFLVTVAITPCYEIRLGRVDQIF